MEDTLLKIDDLCIQFNTGKKPFYAIDGVSFVMKQGEILGVVGESGCGKSITAISIMKLIPRTSRIVRGEIWFQDKLLNSLAEDQMRNIRGNEISKEMGRAILIISHDIGVIAELCEHVVVMYAGEICERARVRKMVDEVQLDESMLDRLPHEFSGGKRQRIDRARDLMLNPSFIIADEPVSALDVSVRSQILNLMKELQAKLNLTYLFISHDLNVVYYMSDRVGVMYMGKIVELAPVEEIYRNPMHPYTKSMISAIPTANPDERKERIILKGDVQSAAGMITGCPFASRCPYVMDVCNAEAPALKQYDKSHSTMCHLYD